MSGIVSASGFLSAALREQLRAQIVEEALSWVEPSPGRITPYEHGQHVKGMGCDCIGLIGGVGLALGFASARRWAGDPEAKGYGRIPDPIMLMRVLARYMTPIAIKDAGFGDVLLFRFKREPHHFGIISDMQPMRIVHAYASARKVCENSIDGMWREGVSWRSLIVGAWRYRELG